MIDGFIFFEGNKIKHVTQQLAMETWSRNELYQSLTKEYFLKYNVLAYGYFQFLKNLQNFIWTKRQEQTIKLFYWRTKMIS